MCGEVVPNPPPPRTAGGEGKRKEHRAQPLLQPESRVGTRGPGKERMFLPFHILLPPVP